MDRATTAMLQAGFICLEAAIFLTPEMGLHDKFGATAGIFGLLIVLRLIIKKAETYDQKPGNGVR